MAEDLRAVLRMEDKEHHQQHCEQTSPVSEHDLHLDGDIVSERLVGKVASRQTKGTLYVKIYLPTIILSLDILAVTYFLDR